MTWDKAKYCKDILEFVDAKTDPKERIDYLFAALFVADSDNRTAVKTKLVENIREYSKNVVSERYHKLIMSETFNESNLLISAFVGTVTGAYTMDEWKEVADEYIIKMKEEQHDNQPKHQATISI